MNNDKHICFLQGPAGYFFWHLAQALIQQNVKVTRINLCPGDRLNWLGSALNYRGSLQDWEHFIEHTLTQHKVTDLMLLGEQREYHRIAVVVAKRLNITVNVCELGYLRPDWLTFELDGLSGNSRFSKDPAQIIALANGLPKPSLQERYRNHFFREATADVSYHIANILFGFLFPRYQSHLLKPGLWVDIGIGLHLLRTKLRHKKVNALVRSVLLTKQPYFVFPLQIENDFQIRAYSSYNTIGDAITEVITSFAKHAAPDSLLVIKEHPREQIWCNWRQHCMSLARELGLTDRVVHLDGGAMEQLIDRSQGVITINSTSGLQGILHEKPVKVLGQAIYDIEGLCHQGSLDDFLRKPSQPLSELREAFINLLGASIQVKGGFYSLEGRDAAIRVMRHRLTSGKMNQPLPLYHD